MTPDPVFPVSASPRLRVFGGLLRSLLLLGLPFAVSAEPFHVYLTWQDSLSRTMTVNFHTRADDAAEASVVCYDLVSHEGDSRAYAFQARGAHHRIAGLPDQRDIHVVELANLRPDTTYYFVAGDPGTGFSAEKRFRTLPEGDEPIRFVTGGDMGVGQRATRLLKRAAATDPAFVLIGGDIAYVNGDLTKASIWDRWLDTWENLMVTRDGLTIPLIAAIGNHETNKSEGPPEVKAPFYYGLFAQGGRGYFSRSLGGHAALLALDSGHTAEHAGDQATWLEGELKAHHRVPFTFACYHVPLYPSHRVYDGDYSDRGRKSWGPLFDRFHLTAGFENHDHTFKRSRLLRDGKPDPAGTLYLGDGCFGREPRTVDAETRWYLVDQRSEAHFWQVDVAPGGVVYQAVNDRGLILDVALSPRPD